MQYTYPQQYIFIPPDMVSGLASGIFIIGSVALFIMFRKFILNFYLKKERLLAISNLLYAAGILLFVADTFFYAWKKIFLDDYAILSLLSVIIGILVVLGVPKFRLPMFAIIAFIIALIPIEIPNLSYTVQSRTYTVVIKYIPLELFVAGLIIYLSIMFILTRVYGPVSLSISLAIFSILLYVADMEATVNPLVTMALHVLSFSFFIASGLFGAEKTIISGFDKTLVAYLVTIGVGSVLYTVHVSIPLAISLSGVVLFGGVAAYFSTIFESKYYKFRDIPSLLLSLGDLLFSLVSLLLIPHLFFFYGMPEFSFMDRPTFTVIVFEMLLFTIILFAIASLTIIRQQKTLPILSFLAGVGSTIIYINPLTYRPLIVVINAIIFLIPTLIFLRFGYRLHKMKSPGASVTLSTGIVLLLYIVSYGYLLQVGTLSLLESILFFFAAVATTFISMYGIIIIPASRSVKKE